MESLLGLQEMNPNLDENFKLVPWLNWEEWDFVRLNLFSSSPDSFAKALRRIAAWRSRGCLPVVIDVTASIIEIQHKDPHFRAGLSNEGSDLEEMLAMLYTMAIVRLVNGVIEKTRKTRKNEGKSSIAAAAEKLGMPRMLVDIRHEGSHRELPSLQLLRVASVEAVNWLKSHYWDLQKNAIPYQSGKSSNVRKEIKSKLREMALNLKVKQNSDSSSVRVKGNRAKRHEQMVGAVIHGRNKFFSVVASKFRPSKYIGSKKQITKTMKSLIRLYSFFALDVVSVLLELLLNTSNSIDLEDSPEKIEINLSLDVAQAVFDDWKPVIRKVCKKEPELLLSLLKAIIDMIESRISIRDDFGSEHFSLLQYDSEAQHILVLSSLFKWLVLVLKGLKITQHDDQGRLTDTTDCLPKTLLMELVRRCLQISDPENGELLDSATVLSETIRDDNLRSKLLKLSSLTKLYPSLAEDTVSSLNTNDLNHQEEYLRQAAEKLELVQCRKISSASIPSTQDDIIEDTNIWTVAKSWNPCPIGMLPRAVGSSGCLPVLDHGINSQTSNAMDTEEHLEPASMDTERPHELRHSNKREASFDIETISNLGTKRMKNLQDSEFSEPDTSNSIASPDQIKGSLLIGGVWQKVGNHELQDITSRVGILTTRRKIEA
ncbi:Protein LAS1 [Bienertia sinuspersici]